MVAFLAKVWRGFFLRRAPIFSGGKCLSLVLWVGEFEDIVWLETARGVFLNFRIGKHAWNLGWKRNVPFENRCGGTRYGF